MRYFLLFPLYFLSCSQTPILQDLFGLNLSQTSGESSEMLQELADAILSSMPDVDEEETHGPDLRSFDLNQIPKFFDSRTRWPKCVNVINHVRNQRKCGTSWAVHAASVISDRLCIGSDGGIQVQISADDILRCCPGKCSIEKREICHCDVAWRAFNYGLRAGAVTQNCKPDTNLGNSEDVSCERKCTNQSYHQSYKNDKYFVKMWYRIKPYASMQAIQREILLNGPVESWMRMHDDFARNYQNGVLQTSEGVWLFNHFVKIVGWGVEKNVNYWLCVNSWGHKWGKLNGFFKVLRGRNHLGIESFVYGALTYNAQRHGRALAGSNSGSGVSWSVLTTSVCLVIIMFRFI